MTFVEAFSSHINGDEKSTFIKRGRRAAAKRKPRIASGHARSWLQNSASNRIQVSRLRRARVSVTRELFGGADWDAYVNEPKPAFGVEEWEDLTAYLTLPNSDIEFSYPEARSIHFSMMPLKGIYAIAMRLERLTDGWNGPDSLAPSKVVIRDVYSVLRASDCVRLEPEIEVDDDGSVVLEWRNGDRAFALTFYGNNQVIGTVSPSSSAYPAWRVRTDDESSVGDKLSEQSLNGFVRG